MDLRLAGLGACLPDRIVTNDEVSDLVGIGAQRIAELFEVRRRHWVRRFDAPEPAEGQHCSDLAAEAGRRALRDAALDVDAIDTLVTVSITPDFANPPLDRLVAAKLGLGAVVGIDLRSACAGLFRALLVVEGLIAAGRSRCALVVAAETISPFFRFGRDVPKDQRLNAALYGDGAGAMVVSAAGSQGPRLQHVVVCSTGDPRPPGITFRGMMSATPPSPERYAAMDYLGHQDFRTVLTRGTELFWQAGNAVMERAGTTIESYRYLLAHQATGNMRSLAAKHGVPPEKFPTNIERVGNTIAASIPILLEEIRAEGRLASGDRLLLLAAESSTWSYGGMEILWE